jgi:hypothetical protein
MGAVLLVSLLAPAYWWIARRLVTSTENLSKYDWRRAAFLLLFLGIMFGIVVLQIWLLTAMNSDAYARHNVMYALVADCLLFLISLFQAGPQGGEKTR